jgi:hypothetical protein
MRDLEMDFAALDTRFARSGGRIYGTRVEIQLPASARILE